MNLVRKACIAFVLTFFYMSVIAAAPMKVMVTVDVESFANGNPDKQIWGKQADGEHGINRIMDLLDKHGFKGTFYLNVYEAAKFGEPRIAEVARAIYQRGHDLQLHTHPLPMYGVRTMQSADYDRQVEILKHGKELIREWTGKTVIAHRAGAFAANLETLKAVRAAGLTIDNSFSPASHFSMLSQQLPASNFPQIIDGVVELPVSYYTQLRFGSWQSLRILDVEASSLKEFKSVIRQLRDGKAPFANILMHSFSFVRYGVADTTTERRFDQMLEFLATEPGLEVVTVSQLSPSWASQASGLKEDANPVPYTGPWLTYLRAAAQAGKGGENLVVTLVPVIAAGFSVIVFLIWRLRARSKKSTL